MTGYLAIIAAGIIWAAGGLLVRYLQLYGFEAMSIALLRLSLAWLLLSVWILLGRRCLFRARPKDLLWFALLGAIGPAGSQPLFIWSVTLTTVAVAAILNYTAPVFVMILGRILFKEQVTPAKVAALVLTMAGLVLVTGVYKAEGGVSPLAFATGLGSGLLYGTYTLILKRAAAGYHPLTIQWWAMLFGLPLVTVYAWPTLGALPASLPLGAYAVALAIAGGPGFLAFILFTGALGRVQASRASIVATIEPAAATILGFLVLGENMGLPEVSGIILVLAGISLVALSQRREDAAVRGRGEMAGRAASRTGQRG